MSSQAIKFPNTQSVFNLNQLTNETIVIWTVVNALLVERHYYLYVPIYVIILS